MGHQSVAWIRVRVHVAYQEWLYFWWTELNVFFFSSQYFVCGYSCELPWLPFVKLLLESHRLHVFFHPHYFIPFLKGIYKSFERIEVLKLTFSLSCVCGCIWSAKQHNRTNILLRKKMGSQLLSTTTSYTVLIVLLFSSSFFSFSGTHKNTSFFFISFLKWKYLIMHALRIRWLWKLVTFCFLTLIRLHECFSIHSYAGFSGFCGLFIFMINLFFFIKKKNSRINGIGSSNFFSVRLCFLSV